MNLRLPVTCLLFALFCWTMAAQAIDSEPPFQDPLLQERYQQLIHEFRCLVCQDETIADSNADLAADFRRQVHNMIAEGKSDAEIRHFMVDRYGNFIIYKPPLLASTWALWIGPFALLAIALGTATIIIRRRWTDTDAPPDRGVSG